MKRRLLCMLLLLVTVLCFARGKQEVIVSEYLPTESRDVVVTIVNKTEADFSTIAISTMDALSGKSSTPVRLMFSVRSGESKSIALENNVLYKLELYDNKGHKFSKKATYSQVITDTKGNALSEEGFQLFTQPWQKIVFTEQDFEPQTAIDVFEVFFGMYGNEEHEEAPEKTCSVIIVNTTGEPVEYISIVKGGTTRSASLTMGKGQSGVLDIKQNEEADISLITRSQHVYTKSGLIFESENQTVMFTVADREINAEKAANFVSSALGNINNALSMTTQAFASVFGKQVADSEFEAADTEDDVAAADDALPFGVDDSLLPSENTTGVYGSQNADAETAPAEKSFWSRYFSWLPWVD